MKSLLFSLLLLTIGFTFTQCKKDSNNDTNPTDTTHTTVIIKDYLPLTTGSTFTYSFLTDSTTTTIHAYAIAGDTIVNAKTYHKFTSADTATEYYAKSGARYYHYFSVPAMGVYGYENLCLMDSVAENTTWKDSVAINNPLGIPPTVNVVFTYVLLHKDMNYTVNGVSFANVIHVQMTDASIAGLASAFATGNFYYAKGVGLIESNIAVQDVSMFGINPYTSTRKLTAYTIK